MAIDVFTLGSKKKEAIAFFKDLKELLEKHNCSFEVEADEEGRIDLDFNIYDNEEHSLVNWITLISDPCFDINAEFVDVVIEELTNNE